MSSSALFSQALTSSIIRDDIEIWKPLENPTASRSGNDFRFQIPLGFNFVYDNTTYSTIYAYENGFASFSGSQTTDGALLPNILTTTTNNIVSWYYADLFTTGSLSYKIEGTAPFRVLTIQHLGARLINDLTGNTFDAQIKFYETTNEIKIIYNTVTGFGFSEQDGYLLFQGTSNTRWVNVHPRVPTLPSLVYYSTSVPTNVQPGLTQDVRKYFSRGRSFTLTSTPKISGLYPANNTVLASGKVYSGDLRPFVRVSRDISNKPITIRYTITGPLNQPTSKVIYTAINTSDINSSEYVNPDPQPVGTNIRVFMPHAKGPAGRLSDGALNLTDISQFPSGEYRVDAYLEYLDGTPYTNYATSRFIIAYQRDLAVLNILEPIYNPGSIYQFSGPGVPVKFLAKNQGADTIYSFLGKYTVFNEAGVAVKTVTDTFKFASDPMYFNTEREFTFPQLYKADAIGVYSIQVELSMLNSLPDQFPDNNIFPRTGDAKKYFEVAYQIEAEVLSLLNPASLYINRPIRLKARFRNNGVSDISNTTARIQISLNGSEVYNELAPLKELPSGIVRETDVVWEKPFIPNQTGNYVVKVTVYADLDEVPANNTKEFNIVIQEGMSGTYTITKTNGSYTTIAEAVTALYEKGVSGDVTFLLSDDIYVEGNPALNSPAIDFSSSIVGLDNPNNSVTFTIDPQRATRASVQINLYSSSGIGVFFGSTNLPSNSKAPVLDVNEPLIPKYSNAPQNIIFDGGNKRSLKFTIGTTSPFRAVFYLGNGASNITIKNLLIEDGILQASSNNCRLPLSSFNSFLNKFEYDADQNVNGTYSSGIVMRSKPPMDPSYGTNPFRMDTLANFGNEISGNEIQKFAYGVVSIGIGHLVDNRKVEYVKYYNNNNKINNNMIYNIVKSAIFLGYEMNTEVFGNRIFNITGGCGFYTAGISAGGEGRVGKNGFNNIDLFISSNEISNIRGNYDLYGISIVQSRNDYVNLDKTYTFPDVPESMRIVNNIIWGFDTQVPTSSIIAIMIATERQNTFDWANMEFMPRYTNYYTRNDLVTNNTIIIDDDEVVNTGSIIGVAVLNSRNAQIVNNAISITDPDVDVNNPATASMFFYGLHPNKGGFLSNRNAFWLDSPDAALFRFIETDSLGRILEEGFKREFVTLSQWQNWTDQDWNSTYGNFTNDFVLTGIAPFNLRIRNNPYPMGSILNNRGMKVEGNDVDIDGNLRGDAGENYDIGALEFRGRTFGRDAEVVAFMEPGAYKATVPYPFSDAEYIMTTAPVSVKAIVRNNGLLPISAQSASLRILRETTVPGQFSQIGNVITLPLQDILFSEDKVIDFLTGDGINNPPSNYEFFPETYGELRNVGYVVPDQFKTMEANVTPLYRLEITLPSDEFNANNVLNKTIRFFIRKSPVKLLISAENIKVTPITDTDDLDIIAGNLNLDSLKASFFRLGWMVDLSFEDPRIDIDIFDRRKWEPRSINYPMYRSLFWTDGHDFANNGGLLIPKRLTRYDRDQIAEFLASGTIEDKKNLFVGSQEIVRNETPYFPDWLRDNLSAKIGNPENPMGPGGDYNGKYVRGIIIGKDLDFLVRTTDFFGDDVPRVAANLINNPGIGQTDVSMIYKSHINDISGGPQVPNANRAAVLGTVTPRYNIIFAGVDWRHWANLDGIIRAFFDYTIFNGGLVVPVELLSFDALQVGNRVDLNWVTASEINTSRFVVEKSLFNEAGRNFLSIGEVNAAGNSTISTFYGPFVDTKVDMGKTYAYRLKTIDRNGDFDYSDEKVVTLTGLSGNIELKDINPNPVSDAAEIEFTLGNEMDVNLVIYDNSGKNIHTIVSGKAGKGIHKYSVNVSQFASGSYTVVLQSGEIAVTTKLNVVK